MKYEPLPVTPALITWARQRSGLSLDDLVGKFKHIAAWEAGDASPTYPQLEQLSEKLKLPIAVFFFPLPPDIEPISNSFRTLPEPQFNEIPYAVRVMLGKAKAMQLSLGELAGGRNPAGRLVTRDVTLDPGGSVRDMAVLVREYLNVSLLDQVSWASVENALENWRAVLLSVGVFVFKDAFHSEEFSGFCLYDDEFPIIYVNNSNAKSRQIFTLFHELAHLLFRTSGIDTLHDTYLDELPEDDRRVEIACNQFAGEFLVPDDDFEKSLKGQEPTEATAELLAARYHVSREVIFRKMLDRKLIGRKDYEDAAERWAAQQSSGGSGGDYYNTQFAYLGLPYISLAFDSYYKNRIDNIQLADYLNIAPKNLGAFEERFLRRA